MKKIDLLLKNAVCFLVCFVVASGGVIPAASGGPIRKNTSATFRRTANAQVTPTQIIEIGRASCRERV